MLCIPSLLRVYQCNSFPGHTSGERLTRSPEVLPFGWSCRYFFFAAFFAAFFAGAFLAAFFVAILPILPFDDFASMLQMLVQLKNV
jgi:hypothetical protein